jgi:hypothetical protein
MDDGLSHSDVADLTAGPPNTTIRVTKTDARRAGYWPGWAGCTRPRIDSVRHTTVGGLALGYGFV